jgi:hypothetical protein
MPDPDAEAHGSRPPQHPRDGGTALHDTFSPQAARTLEFHAPPKQGSWLNIAGIELAVFSNSRLSPCIADDAIRRREIHADVSERDSRVEPVKWRFTAQDARRKLARLYQCVSA